MATTSHFSEDHSVREPENATTSMHGARGETEGDATGGAAPHEDSASSIVQGQEKTPEVRLTKRQKLKRHCGRFWWWYLIGVVIFLAILLPILFEVIIPAVVQDIVDDQSLPIYNGALLAISTNQIVVSLNTSMHTPLPARIEAFNLSLYNRNTTEYRPFITLELPEQNVDGTTEVQITNQTVTVEDEDELVKWFHTIFDNPNAPVSVRGSPKVHLGALDYDPTLDKELEVPALNYLKGFDIEEMNFMLEPDENGNNMKGTLNLPNSGVLAMGLGNVSFHLMAADVTLGEINLYDAVLPPGNNTRSFTGNLYFNELIPNLNTILAVQRDSLSQGFLTINSTGKSVMINGEHVGFLERVFVEKTLQVQIPVTTLLGNVVSSVLEADGDTLMAAFGDTFGNETLLETIMDHWDNNDMGTNLTRTGSDRKRAAPGMSLMMNMLRLGTRTGK